MNIFDKAKQNAERKRELKGVQKELNMNNKCTKEVDQIFNMMGFDLAEFEVVDATGDINENEVKTDANKD